MIETTAVLDRFENDRAVLVLDGDHAVGEVVCDPERLPAEGRETDAVFAVRVVDGELRSATYRPDETTRRRERAQRRFDSLSSRLGGSADDASDEPDDPTSTDEHTGSDEATDQSDPTDQIDQTDPTDQIDQTDPTDQSDTTGSGDLADSTASADERDGACEESDATE